MRLSEKQIKVLKDKLNSISSSAKLYLFGSRVDDTKKGGDIDLLVVSKEVTKKDLRLLRIDFLIRKIFRTLDEYEFENQGTLVDVVNNAHKRGLFENIEELRIMKDVRNTIVHEYIEDELVEIFDEVLEYSKRLIEIINNTLNYINTKCVSK